MYFNLVKIASYNNSYNNIIITVYAQIETTPK